jgi:hypothetical protein
LKITFFEEKNTLMTQATGNRLSFRNVELINLIYPAGVEIQFNEGKSNSSTAGRAKFYFTKDK